MSLSYGSSLFAGSMHDPGATSFNYMRRKAHAYVVIGVSEIDNVFPGTLYLSQLFISDEGEIIGVRRKLVSTTFEKFVFSPGDGSDLRVFDTPYGKISGLSCGEHAHGLFKYALLAMGSQP